MTNDRSYGALGGQNNPFVIDDDDDLENTAARIHRLEEETRAGIRFYYDVVSRHRRRAETDDSDEEDLNSELRIEDALADSIAEVIDLTDDDDSAQEAHASVPEEAESEIPVFALENGLVLRAGMTVELKNTMGPLGVQFVRIQSIVRPHHRPGVIIRGWGYTRARQLEGLLPTKLNEVAMVAEYHNADSRKPEQALLSIAPGDVKREREMRVSNTPYPEHRFDPADYSRRGKDWVAEQGPLVCRYRYDIHFNAGSTKPCEWALVRIGEDEADPEYRMPDEKVLNRWRGGKVPGGAYKPGRTHSHHVVDVDADHDQQSNNSRALTVSPGQKYTAGDVFAGAGGASRGIERAGVRLLFAVDHWSHAAESLRSNFATSDIYNMEVTDFILAKNIRYDVDILHLSPPCQFWSPAHTVAGKNDDHNIAVLFSCPDLIEKFRPRLFTVEQTFGLLSPKFKEFFNTLIHGFTKLGYSVRWKVVPLANYGVPQLRKRLIMIGAAPGERLPPLPPPTHSKNGAGGLKPWATPKTVLAPLARCRGHELHRPALSRRFDPPKAPWDPNQLARTITTNGGQNYHWDGTRDFTLLEYAVLQGFPPWHRFRGRYVKKQIGNAFAPTVVRVLYDHLVTWLLRQDGFDPAACRAAAAAAAAPPDGLVVVVDDGEDGCPAPATVPSGDCLGDDDGDGNEVACLGSRNFHRTLSEEVRALNRACKEEAALEDAMLVDDLSDTETLRPESERGDYSDVMDLDPVIDLTVGLGKGTADEPYDLSD